MPQVKTQVTLDIPDHQILLSFDNDADAVAFDGWWSNEGEQMFDGAIEEYRE